MLKILPHTKVCGFIQNLDIILIHNQSIISRSTEIFKYLVYTDRYTQDKNYNMDIFNETISCKNCKTEMKHAIVNKNGFELRAIQCPKCKKQIIHPADINGLENFNNLKGKTYNVKLRVVGNSHAISIPKEIVEFMRHQEKMMNDMVRLCFEDMHRLSLNFGKEDNDEEAENLNNNIRPKN